MAGHSHWANIQRRKGAVDAKRGKLFSRLARAIIVAARNGGGDPAMNLTLRYAIDDARAANMPKDSIERAIKKGTGELDDGSQIEEIVYEGYGPAGVAVLVETVTDNRNRTSGEINKIFEKSGGNMGAPGCVAWMFNRKGLLTVAADADEEALMDTALAAGAEDLQEGDEGYEVTTPHEAFGDVRQALEEAGFAPSSASISQVPQTYVAVEGDDARKVLRLMEALDDHDDVQNVHANFDIDDAVLESIEAG